MNKRLFNIFMGLIVLTFFSPDIVSTQSNDGLKSLMKEIEQLKESQKAIQKDLQEIKNQLRARGLLEEDPQNLFIDVSNKSLRGDKKARLTLIEFSEYQ